MTKIKPVKRNHLLIPSRFEQFFEGKALSRYQAKNRLRLTNNNFTIFANSCIGAQIYRDLGLRFDTPFVGSYMQPEDFVEFLKKPKYWMDQKIIEEKCAAICPVGLLGGKLRIYFRSDPSFDVAVEKWNSRKERINWENLFIMLNPLEQDFGRTKGFFKTMCEQSVIEDFLSLKYKNLIVISNKKNHIINNNCVFTWQYRFYQYPPYVGIISTISGKRTFDRYFDVVHWLNTGEIVRRFSF